MPIIRPSRSDERGILMDIWERSVRATHVFLSAEDIIFYRPLVAEFLGSPMEFWTVCCDVLNRPFGFMGLDKDACEGEFPWKLEALFIDPSQSRRGGGTLLVRHARILKGKLRLDVNEQNPGALAFYLRLGFVQTGRSALDGSGRPFPLIHMESPTLPY